MMRKVKLTRQEQWIEDHIEEFVPVSKEEYDQIVKALEARKKDAVLNIRVNSQDLANIKHKAQKMGIKYQTFIAEVIHHIARAN